MSGRRCILFISLLISGCFFNSQHEMNSIGHDVSETGFFPADHPYIRYFGRIESSDSSTVKFSFPGVNIRFTFIGSDLAVRLQDMSQGGIQADGNPARNFFEIYIDDEDPIVLSLERTDSLYQLASGLSDVRHDVVMIKRTEALAGKVEFRGIQLNEGAILVEDKYEPNVKIEFIGNSITCGYGVEADSEDDPFSCSTENVCKSYAVITADKLKAEYNIIAYSGRGISQNYDRSKTNTLALIWRQVFPDEIEPACDHSRYIPDLVVMNLGTNDFFSGTIVPSYFRYKYNEFVSEVRVTYPNAKIICLVGPMLNNTEPENALNMARIIIGSIVRNLNKEGDSNIFYFELTMQTGEYGFGADWHPSAGQQKHNAKELIRFLLSVLDK